MENDFICDEWKSVKKLNRSILRLIESLIMTEIWVSHHKWGSDYLSSYAVVSPWTSIVADGLQSTNVSGTACVSVLDCLITEKINPTKYFLSK